MHYLYDGSFEGLLTCIYYNYYGEKASGIYRQDSYQPVLMIDSTEVITEPALAARVYQAIEKISGDALENVYHAFVSSAPDKEILILNYLRLGFRLGSKVDAYHSHPDVYPLHKVARKVTTEAHRFLGLLRFADTGNFLYAVLAPDHYILPLIADHFADRLAGERWIIHDRKRGLAVVYDGHDLETERSSRRRWYITDFPRDGQVPLNEKEQYYQKLWQQYFDTIAIESRCNPRLQARFVPYRYRHDLVEFKNHATPTEK
ncbi:MAG TPA: hypothetical protein DD811_07290 [Syntrophomonas sp.]|jgi:probable DNA metabolism protein|nr:hypothetical protein [Syntrophomonas sp.]